MAVAIEPITGGTTERSLWWLAVGFVVVVSAASLAVPWRRLPAWSESVPAFLYLVSAGLMRHATFGTVGGYGPLVLLPMLWVGLYGSRRQLQAIVVAGGLVLAVPAVIFGAPRYPSTGWRGSLVLIFTGAVAGAAAQRTRRALEARTAQLAARESELLGSLEAMQEPVGRYSAVRDSAGLVVDLRCTYLNAAGRQALGPDAIGQLLSVRLTEQSRLSVLASWLSAVGQSTPVIYEIEAHEANRDGVFEVHLIGMEDGLIAVWRDVTHSRQTEEQLRNAEALWHSVADAVADAVLTLDPRGHVIWVSPSLPDLLGIPAELALGRSVFEAVHFDDHLSVRRAIDAAFGSSRRHSVEFRIHNPSRVDDPVWLEARVHSTGEDRDRQIHVGLRDITGTRREHARLGHEATHDPLTGLLNRTGFRDSLERHLERATSPALVFYIDLDDFKPINDRLGHLAGDVVLAEVARRLQAELRDGDAVARIGGDEFALFVLPPPHDYRMVALRRRLAKAISLPIDIGADVVVSVGASIGSAYGAIGATVDVLLAAADEDMYRIKREHHASTAASASRQEIASAASQ